MCLSTNDIFFTNTTAHGIAYSSYFGMGAQQTGMVTCEGGEGRGEKGREVRANGMEVSAFVLHVLQIIG